MWNAKRIVAVVSAVALLAAPVAAQQAAPDAPTRGAVPAKRSGEQPAVAREKEHRGSTEEVLAAIEQLKSLVQQQSQQIEAQGQTIRDQQHKLDVLERQIQAQGSSLSAAAATAKAAEDRISDIELVQGQLEAVADSANETAGRVTKLQTDVTAQNRSNDSKLRQLGNFRFSGDLRLRYEPFLQEGALARNRYRVRARFNVTGNITDEIFGGLSLATGTLDDVNSTNQTLTGFLTRKNIGIDRMYVSYKPKWFKEDLKTDFTFTGGKMPYPWLRTPLTFDNDINPDGFGQTFAWDLKTPLLKNVTIVGFELPLSEVSGTLSSTTGLVTAPGYDSWIFGGQIQSRWKLHDRINLGMHVAGVNFINSDRIAQALGAGLSPSLPNTNTLRTNATGGVVGYAARYLYLDTLAQLDIRTNASRWPISLMFNFVQNMRGTLIPQSASATPGAPVDNRERSAYWGEIQFGRMSEPRDMQFGYTFVRIEKDAIIGAFNESDLRAATNVRNHRLNFNYQWFRNVQFNYAIWLGKLANPAANQSLVPPGLRQPGMPCGTSPFTGCEDSLLKRQQFDLVYRF